jgi:WD40 repeat protein/predicted Ser/Thr protein kinase
MDTAASTLGILCADIAQTYRFLKLLQNLLPSSINCHALPEALNDADIECWLIQRWPLVELNLPHSAAITSTGMQKLISSFPTLRKLRYSCNSNPVTTTIATFGEGVDSNNALAILPNGHIVSGSWPNALHIWDGNSKESITFHIEDNHNIWALGILHDGRIASGSSDTNLCLWNANTYQRIATLKGHTKSVIAIAIHPNGRIISGSSDNTIRVWNTDNYLCVATLEGHTGSVKALAILPDGRIVSGSTDTALRLWEANTYKHLDTFEGHTYGVNALAILPNGRIVSGSDDKTLRVWNVDTKECVALAGHTSYVFAVAILPDGRIVSGSHDCTIRLWNVDALQCIAVLKEHTDTVRTLAILPDGRMVSGSWDNTLRLWDTGIKHLSLLQLDKLQPQLTQCDNQLKLNFNVTNHSSALLDEEMQAVINTYQNIIQLCFGLMPSNESNPFCLAYRCQDAAQASSIEQFLHQCWRTRKQNRQQALPHRQEGKPALIRHQLIHPPFELRPLDVHDFRRMVIQLETNPAICILNLSGVTLGKEGLNCLLPLIRTNKTLTFIDISYTGLTDQDAKQLIDALEANQTLLRLNLKGNPVISSVCLNQIHEQLKAKQQACLQDVEIPLTELSLDNKVTLGKGGYGKVYKLQWKNASNNSAQWVAMKVLKPTTSNTIQRQFKREALMLASFKHPYIVQLHGINFSDKMRIVMEYVPGGSLQNVLNQQTQAFPVIKQCRYALDIAYGLAFIHECNVLHLDLKPDNILVTEDGRLKLTDFGASLLQEQASITDANKRGTYRYMSPELWEAVDKTGYTTKADSYSYGIILWEIASAKKAYDELTTVNDIALYNHIVKQEKRPQPNKPPQTAESIATLISRCWKQRREERPEAQEIVQALEAITRQVSP